MSRVEDFLSTEEELEIINAIKLAEKNTSGEIRVHIESSTEKTSLERAKEVFYYLKMDETILQNGVLFYIAVDSKQFAIIGDTGINAKVPSDFWNAVKALILPLFSKEKFKEGLIVGIIEAGEKLKEYFPYQNTDTNELTDAISKG